MCIKLGCGCNWLSAHGKRSQLSSWNVASHSVQMNTFCMLIIINQKMKKAKINKQESKHSLNIRSVTWMYVVDHHRRRISFHEADGWSRNLESPQVWFWIFARLICQRVTRQEQDFFLARHGTEWRDVHSHGVDAVKHIQGSWSDDWMADSIKFWSVRQARGSNEHRIDCVVII